MSDWARTTLGDVASITIGRTPPRNESRYWTPDLERPFCTIADMTSWLISPDREGVTALAEEHGRAKRIPAGALLLSFKLSIGRVGFVARDLFPNEAIAWLQPDAARVVPEFLALWLQSHDLTESSGRAVKGQTLNSRSLRAIPVSMPHLAEQRRIVDLVGAFDAQQGALVAESSRLSGTYQQLLASCIASGREAAHSRVVRLAECLVLDLEISKVEPGAEYRIAGVLNAGQGLIDKGVVTADTTGYSRLHRLTADKLVMRRLTAWEGPIAVIPPEFNGYFASAEFPTFAIDPNLILPEFMAHVCRWPGLWDEMRQRVTGSVQRRKRLSPSQLMDVQLQLPEIPVQAAFGQALTALEQTRRATEKEGRTVAVARARLLRDLLDSTLEIPKSYDSLLESA